MSEPEDKTLHAACCELREAVSEFALIVCCELKIDKLAGWLTRMLKKGDSNNDR